MTTRTAEKQAVLDQLYAMGCHDKYVERAVDERGLTAQDIEWNQRLGRPLAFKETVHPNIEVKRRAEWQRTHPKPKG